jgi:succinate dehydrogenase hydrophobic anchor subunit
MLFWGLQRITALLLFYYLTGHWLIIHYYTHGNITFDKVKERLFSPFWFWFDIFFLLIIIFHALNGLRNIFFDFDPPAGFRNAIIFVLAGLGILLLILGWFILSALLR